MHKDFMCISALFTITKKWKQPKRTCACAHEYYSAIKKKEGNPVTCYYMDYSHVLRGEGFLGRSLQLSILFPKESEIQMKLSVTASGQDLSFEN